MSAASTPSFGACIRDVAARGGFTVVAQDHAGRTFELRSSVLPPMPTGDLNMDQPVDAVSVALRRGTLQVTARTLQPVATMTEPWQNLWAEVLPSARARATAREVQASCAPPLAV